jgi:ATP-dependent protease ClpP protease subunit
MLNVKHAPKTKNDDDKGKGSDDCGSSSNISHQDNYISFYSEISDSTISNLIGVIREKNVQCCRVQYEFDLETPPPIHLHINSYGGWVFSGFAAMEQIIHNKIPIYTYVDGMSASAATYLSIVGKKRYIYEHASMLIHQISSGFWGKYNEFLDEKKNLDMLMDTMRGMYKEYTSMTTTMINNLLKKDLYLTAEECLKYGLVDEIIKRK